WRLSRTQGVAPVDCQVTHLVLQPRDMAATDHPALAIVDGHAWRVVANYKEHNLRHFTIGHVAWVWLHSPPSPPYLAPLPAGRAPRLGRVQGQARLGRHVAPAVHSIRLQRRVPVRSDLDGPPNPDALCMGTDGATVGLYCSASGVMRTLVDPLQPIPRALVHE